ncbi:MAG TPA: FecR family protein [Candidatus Nitrosotalea sp.]|nr:FecR family protein [Candidatus Nitrosotalea sp.]
MTGTAHLTRGTATSNVNPNLLVQTGDRLNTDAGSGLTITLTDASKLQLGESSVLAIDQHVLGPNGGRESTRVSLFSGLVHSFVNLTATGAPNFEVHTPNAVAAARATDYATGYQEGNTREGYSGCNRFTDVAVYKGTVGIRQAATPNAPEVSVPEGYETTVPCGMSPLTPGPIGMTGASSISGAAAGGGGGGAGIGALAPAPIGAPPPSCPVCVP